MITQSAIPKIEKSADFLEYKMGVDDEDLPMLFGILRGSLYSNKPLAIVRELSANAVDANVFVGKKDLPINVTLPTRFAPELKVRDFGAGLDDEDVAKIYTRYCKSTKRTSNEYIGMLGIGAKSPWCMVQSFTVNSYQNKKKTIWNAYIDASKVGKMARLATEPTKEEDGLEVVVSIPTEYIDRINTCAFDLYKYYRIKPKITGGITVPNLEVKYFISGDDWGYSGDRNSVAIMGGVAYKLDSYALGETVGEEVTQLIDSGIRLDFNIGELEVSASRESLEYTPVTIDAIKSKLTRIVAELVKITQKKFNDCKNLYEAKMLYREIFYTSNGYGTKLDNIINQKIVFNGMKVNDYRLMSGTKGLNVYHYMRGYSRHSDSNRITSDMHQYVSCDKSATIFYNDLETVHSSRNRAYTLLYPNHVKSDTCEAIEIISFIDDASKKEWEKEMGILVSYFPNWSTIPKTKRISKGGGGVGSPKHSAKAFEFLPEKAQDYYYRGQSEYFSSAWEIVEVDEEEDEGVYVVIERFKPVNYNLGSLKKIMKACETLKIDLETIHGFKPSKAAKLGKGWVELKTYIKANLDVSKIINDKVKQEIVDANHAQGVSDVNEAITKRQGDLNKKGLLYQFIETRKEMLKNSHKSLYETVTILSDNCGSEKLIITGKPSFELNKIREELDKRYPLLRIVDDSWRYRDAEKEIFNSFTEYANWIDSGKK